MKYHAASGDITRFLQSKYVEGAGGVVGFEPQSAGDITHISPFSRVQSCLHLPTVPLNILQAAPLAY